MTKAGNKVRVMKNLRIVVASVGLALAPFSAAAAQDAAPPVAAPAQQVSAHLDLVLAIQEGVDVDLTIENQLAVVRSMWGQDPNMVAAEATYPGLFDAMIAAARPVIMRQNLEVQKEFQPRFAAALAEKLSDAEARTIADFYRSPMGRKLMAAMSANMDSRASIEGFVETGEVDMGDFKSDVDSSTAKTLSGLSQSDMEELGRLYMEEPALLKLTTLQPAMVPVRAEMEKAGATPERQQEIYSVIETAAQKHIAQAQ